MPPVIREQKGRWLGFLPSQLSDPRRIQLRENRFIEAYQRRGDIDVVETVHELTKLRRADIGNMLNAITLLQQPSMLPILYIQDPEFPLQPRIRLPEPAIPNRPFFEVIRSRRSCRAFAQRPLTLSELSSLLFSALGETGRLSIDRGDNRPVEVSLRSIPSGGALHPTRVFAAIIQSGDPSPGIYHYHAPGHALELVKPLLEPVRSALLAAIPIHPDVVDLDQASAIFFVTTKFWRPRTKYGSRGYRYCLQEAGAACQNLSLASVALGLGHVVLGGFYDDEVNACLGIDGIDHAVVTAIAVGALHVKPEGTSHNVDY